ncbi:sigma E protease regulator RseP [Thalassotalea sp. M1531]|uniref:Zinc metalloprotease n=1 Tax=Thalassotalea algicola TaxID=2716224 RepID=A0A7Y0LGJ3_9GAMM|nr:sigma E protease regulator RseP [Thalassotalea algicola]NMP33256.1 sigma E protease regulator RseP [Thalassotalea algicola]
MLDVIWNLASFIIALGILVTVHEYGHFWVARKNGVKVERFSVGFGKAIWRKTDKLGTEYVIALIPLGGYVKMLDERVDEVSEQDKHLAFNGKTVYQRIAIIAAGPLANFLFAIFAFYLMFLIGVPSIKPVIGEIEAQSIAYQAGLPAQGEIVEVAGIEVKDWQDINMALVGEIGQPSIEIKVQQPDSQYVKSYQLNTQDWKFTPENTSSIGSLGIVPFSPKVHTVVAQVMPNGAAAKAGLQANDKLLSINQKLVNDDWRFFASEIKSLASQEVALSVDRNGEVIELIVIPDVREVNGQKEGYLGIRPTFDGWPEGHQINLAYGVIGSFTESIERTWNLVVLSFEMIGKLITGDVSVKNLSGPIAIAQGAGNSAGYGFVYFLGFLALISINLGIINLLPLPVLDGGHLLYYLIELFTGKPVPEKIQELGFRFGAIALLMLMSIAIFNDISRL